MPFDFDKFLKLPSAKQVIYLLLAGCVVSFYLYREERKKNERRESKHDIYAEDRLKQLEKENAELRYNARIDDSLKTAYLREIQVIYQTQAEETRKQRMQVERIQKNSTIIKKRTDKLADEQ